ncbi:hypothetical protein RMATCC62417_07453 [Rhizopus microsporus]|nr:hypothetical protein RMATCC62417_07453 [Rhizopus microsporus]CEI92597.1 hypothetical protein RMCBS344292_06852 [Rhizopus microsporus]
MSLLRQSRAFSTKCPLLAPKKFVVIAKDFSDPECLQRRLAVRSKHLDGATELKKRGAIITGGAILDSHETGKMKGSAMICTGETIEEVEEMIRNDPYVKNKVWESWTIYPYKDAFNP